MRGCAGLAIAATIGTARHAAWELRPADVAAKLKVLIERHWKEDTTIVGVTFGPWRKN